MDLLATFGAKLAAWWQAMTPLDRTWLGIGLCGQLLFTARWFVQWIATEKARRSTMPEAFWYCSLFGGLLVLAYGVYKVDPVIILGQFGVLIYARNIYFLLRNKHHAAASDARPASKLPGRVKMLLRSTPTSPFGRKVKIAALRLGLMDRIRIVPANPLDPADPLRRDNPLGKMPVLILDDGRRIFDSRVILEHFDHLAGGGIIIPHDWSERLDALTLQAQCDGMTDAGLLVVYEGRHRPQELHHPPWVDYQKGKIVRGLEALAATPPDPARLTVGTIAMGCMLGYLDWRKQVDWRAGYPRLVAWLDAYRAATPEYDATAVSHAD